jgi:hypothetical protein
MGIRAEYTITFNKIGKDCVDNFENALNWIKDNNLELIGYITDQWSYHPNGFSYYYMSGNSRPDKANAKFKFQNENDAMRFKLVWG